MSDKVKCLLVDDVEENLLALEAVLAGDDREIHKATSGPQALELLLVHDFALALLDIRMPTMDGFELAELMRGTERSKHIPIIFITAQSPNEPLPMFRGYESGAVDVLFKPINTEIVRQKAAVFFELHRQREALRQAVQSREDVLAIVSHDMRTPLSVVHTTTSMLLNPKYKLTPEQVREQHERIRRNVDLMNRMIGDLMDMVHLRSGKLSINPKPTIVNDVLRDAVAAHEVPARDKGLQMSYDAGHGCDARRGRPRAPHAVVPEPVGQCGEIHQGRRQHSRHQPHARQPRADRYRRQRPRHRRRRLAAHLRSLLLGQQEAPEDRHGPGAVHRQGYCRCARGTIRCVSEPGVGTTFNITLPLAPH